MTSKERYQVHDPTTCLVSVFSDAAGNRYIQLDTHGSALRKIPGKTSQAFQLDINSANQLKKLIEETYPSLQ
jgi:hypothetical protein